MESAIFQCFSADDVRSLEKGLPRLDQWSSSMLVPFTVRQLSRSHVLWLNQRWFLTRGFDLSCAANFDRVSSWLVSDFGFAVPQKGDPVDAFTSVERFMHADRYGGSTGESVHGGSGRVATVRCYQAKGIGPTPLAGIGANWVHSHGCAVLDEGIREAIYSEIADAEFPHGAVPVVGILNTGLTLETPSQHQSATISLERVIIIRPAALRLAHAERAPMFRRAISGYINAQSDDVARTKDVVRKWCAIATCTEPDGSVALPLGELFRRVGEQIAFGQAHRLFSGGYFSSNITTTGALLDYGGMRSLPTWANARTLDSVCGFGEELKIVRKVIQSLVFYFRKYGTPPESRVEELKLVAEITEACKVGFNRECLRMFGMESFAGTSAAADLVALMRSYYAYQQRHQVNYKHGLLDKQDWLASFISTSRGEVAKLPQASREAQVVAGIAAILSSLESPLMPAGRLRLLAWSSAARLLMPREELYRESLQLRILRSLCGESKTLEAQQPAIRIFIQTTVGKSRRHWASLPPHMVVRAHVSYEGSSALECYDTHYNRNVIWCEGLYVNGAPWLFGYPINRDDLADIRLHQGERWSAVLPMPSGAEASTRAESITRHLPDMQMRYLLPAFIDQA